MTTNVVGNVRCENGKIKKLHVTIPNDGKEVLMLQPGVLLEIRDRSEVGETTTQIKAPEEIREQMIVQEFRGKTPSDPEIPSVLKDYIACDITSWRVQGPLSFEGITPAVTVSIVIEQPASVTNPSRR